jgi:chorismate dehydratase
MIKLKRIGIQPDRYCTPLAEALRETGAFELVFNVPAHNAIGLRDRSLAMALISPVDYARDGSLFRIVPDIAVSSSGATGVISLHFRTGIRTISTLAVDPACPSEAVLARILLAEEFGAAPALVPMMPDLENMLARADAALLVGDVSRNAVWRGESLDLVELWMEMTGGLPFVHGVLCCHERALVASELDLLTMVPAVADRLRHEQRADAGPAQSGAYDVTPEGISHIFDDPVRAGFKEFVTYAFYHGILPDVPELNFYSLGEGSEDSTDVLREPLSPN